MLPSTRVVRILCVAGSGLPASSLGASLAKLISMLVAAGSVAPPCGVYPENKYVEEAVSSVLNQPVEYWVTRVGSVLLENSYVKSPVNMASYVLSSRLSYPWISRDTACVGVSFAVYENVGVLGFVVSLQPPNRPATAKRMSRERDARVMVGWPPSTIQPLQATPGEGRGLRAVSAERNGRCFGKIDPTIHVPVIGIGRLGKLQADRGIPSHEIESIVVVDEDVRQR